MIRPIELTRLDQVLALYHSVVDREFRNISGLMMDHAKRLARTRGVKVLPGDCYAGEGGAVVRHYQRLGFEVTGSLRSKRRPARGPAQVVTLRVD